MIRQNWQMYPKSISETLVDDIIKMAGKTIEASTFNDGGADIRKSRVAWIKDKRILNLLHDHVGLANFNVFNFHIYNVADIQYTEYLASEGGHYNWHHDINWSSDTKHERKLSVTVQLSDPSEYEGGDFVFDECSTPNSDILKQKGTVLVFPSYLRHRVEPVTKGIRKSLVSWFEGPRFR